MLTYKITSFFYFFKCLGGIYLLLCLSISYAQTIEATALQKRLTDPAAIALTGIEIPKLQRFYSARNFQPVWMTAETKRSQLETALAFIASADVEGLDSSDYQLQQLQQLQETGNVAIELELRTTQALLTLTHDLSRGRLIASAADPDWYIPQQSFDAVAFLLDAVAGDNLTQSLNNLAPKKPSYQLLKKTLARYREFASRQATWLHIPNTPLIRPGTAHGVIPLIRMRMTQAYA
ncbi:MAG: murein L,D-transpeptidase, partial [Nitrosomonas sp.]|nr:murein L,D-transpeptidase [Nitrosomonas sp.]